MASGEGVDAREDVVHDGSEARQIGNGTFDDLREAMKRDKKVRSGGLRFVVLKQIGQAATAADVPAEAIEESFKSVGSR